MSNFNPDTFLDATITEPTTRRPPLPAGRDFVGTVSEVKSREWKGKQDVTKSGIVVDVTIEVDLSPNPDVAASVGTDKVVLTDGIMLDTTPGGSIDNGPGKNGKLRRYRDALNMNNPGDTFSFRNMVGRQIRVKIKHELFEGDIFDKVESVAKA